MPRPAVSDPLTDVDSSQSVSPSREDIERRVHGITNAEREVRDAGSVAFDTELAAVARGHSQDMRDRGFVAHTTPDGQAPKDRIDEAGYDLIGKASSPAFCQACGGDLRIYTRPDYCPHCGNGVDSQAVRQAGVSENIAVTYAGLPVDRSGDRVCYESAADVARGVVDQWLNSQGHRENLLNYRWQREGIGVALESVSQGYRIYVTQKFN